MTPLFKGLRLGARVSLLGAGSVLAAASALVVLAVWQSGRYQALARSEVDGLIAADLDHIAQGVYNLVRTEDEAAQQQVNSHLNTARYVLAAAGGVSLSREKTPWEAVDKVSGRTLQVRLPKMLVKGQWLGRNADPAVGTAVVDEVTRLVGGDATIFQRVNERGDMLRVATTVRTPVGRRGVGTFIPAVNPDGTPNAVIAAVLKGDTYRGRAMVLGQWHLTAYEPVRDRGGNLVGMLYVGLELRTIAARVRQAILNTRVGRTGYVYALGGTGKTRGRYIISQNGERDGEDIWDSRDSDGHPVVQAIIGKAVALQPGQLATERYRWQNPGDPIPRWKVARLAYYAPWDWVIGVSVYEDELQGYRSILSEGRARMTGVLALAGLAITLLVGLAGALVAMSLTRPIRRLTAAAESITRGDLGGPMGIRSRDEIGTLAGAFDHMTERLGQTLENLRRSEESYRQIVDTANEGIMVMDGEQHLTFVNARFAELLGRPLEALLGRDIGAFMFEEDLPDRDRRMAARRAGIAEHYERRFRRPDGSAVWTIVSATPLPRHGEEFRGSFAMLTDITARRLAEERLAAMVRIKERVFAATTTEERLKQLTDGAVEALGADFARIWMTRPGDQCAHGCRHAAVTEGPHACRDRSRCLHLMASSGRYTHLNGGHRRVPIGSYKIGRIASGEETRFITNDVTHDPRVHNRQWAHDLGLVAFAGYRLLSAAEKPIGVFALFSRRAIGVEENALLEDLANTASLAIRAGLAEDAIRRLNAELEQRVVQRTIQLEAANQELEAFSYSVSHDLRAPLRAIDGFSRALLDDHAAQLDAEGRQYLQRVRAGSARMAELIDDLLKLSRVTRSEMHRVEVDLSALAGTLAAEFQAGQPERRVEFVIAPGLTARADPAMMRILMQNLLGNAWKFTGQHPAARIEVGAVDRDGQTAFFVRDDGAGFDMAYSGRLFGAFQRAHSLTEFEGTGIGLATVRRIVHRHGGNTWAEGAVEEGATLYFTLPE